MEWKFADLLGMGNRGTDTGQILQGSVKFPRLEATRLVRTGWEKTPANKGHRDVL